MNGMVDDNINVIHTMIVNNAAMYLKAKNSSNTLLILPNMDINNDRTICNITVMILHNLVKVPISIDTSNNVAKVASDLLFFL